MEIIDALARYLRIEEPRPYLGLTWEVTARKPAGTCGNVRGA